MKFEAAIPLWSKLQSGVVKSQTRKQLGSNLSSVVVCISLVYLSAWEETPECSSCLINSL